MRRWMWILTAVAGLVLIVASAGLAIAEGYAVDAERRVGDLTPFLIGGAVGLLILLAGIAGIGRSTIKRS